MHKSAQQIHVIPVCDIFVPSTRCSQTGNNKAQHKTKMGKLKMGQKSTDPISLKCPLAQERQAAPSTMQGCSIQFKKNPQSGLFDQSKSQAREGVERGAGVPNCKPTPRPCFNFLASCLSGVDKGESGGLLVTGGRANCWYQSGNSINSRPKASQKFGKSAGVRRMSCLTAVVTTSTKGKR